MPLTAFLFDLDGTIIDSIELILRSYRHTMEQHRCNEPMPPDDMWIKGLGTCPGLARQITDDKEEIERMVGLRTYNLTPRCAQKLHSAPMIRRMKEAESDSGSSQVGAGRCDARLRISC
jgi:phosphoglycolate phosphatase-like HAD superfamily hydrolase